MKAFNRAVAAMVLGAAVFAGGAVAGDLALTQEDENNNPPKITSEEKEEFDRYFALSACFTAKRIDALVDAFGASSLPSSEDRSKKIQEIKDKMKAGFEICEEDSEYTLQQQNDFQGKLTQKYGSFEEAKRLWMGSAPSPFRPY